MTTVTYSLRSGWKESVFWSKKTQNGSKSDPQRSLFYQIGGSEPDLRYGSPFAVRKGVKNDQKVRKGHFFRHFRGYPLGKRQKRVFHSKIALRKTRFFTGAPVSRGFRRGFQGLGHPITVFAGDFDGFGVPITCKRS